jgi:hypothetical protein
VGKNFTSFLKISVKVLWEAVNNFDLLLSSLIYREFDIVGIVDTVIVDMCHA